MLGTAVEKQEWERRIFVKFIIIHSVLAGYTFYQCEELPTGTKEMVRYQ